MHGNFRASAAGACPSFLEQSRRTGEPVLAENQKSKDRQTASRKHSEPFAASFWCSAPSQKRIPIVLQRSYSSAFGAQPYFFMRSPQKEFRVLSKIAKM